MNKRNVFIIILLVISLAIIPSVLAAGQFDSLLNTITSILEYKIKLPHPPYISAVKQQAIPFWYIAMAFMLLFSIIYPVAGKIPIFKENTGPRKAFSIAFAIIALFGTVVAEWIYTLIGTFTALSVIAALVVGIYFIWSLSKHGFSSGSEIGAEATEKFEAAAQKKHKVSIQELRRMRRPLRRLQNLEFKNLEWANLFNNLGILKAPLGGRGGASAANKQTAKDNMLGELNKINKIAERRAMYISYLTSTLSRVPDPAVRAILDPIIRQSEAADNALETATDTIIRTVQPLNHSNPTVWPPIERPLQNAQNLERTSESLYLKLKEAVKDAMRAEEENP
jgi:hypothetical protein